MADEKKTRVFIADDHPFLRLGIKSMINSTDDMQCCGEAESVSETLSGLESSQPELLLLDLCMGYGDGLDIIKAVRAQYEKLGILILSQLDESLYAERALRAGAQGYIMKERATDDVLVGKTDKRGAFHVLQFLHRIAQA